MTMKSRLKTISTLIRIRDRELQERAAEMNRIQSDLARVRAHRQEIERSRREDARAESIEEMPYIMGFLRALSVEDQRAAMAETHISAAAEAKRIEVTEAWKKLKIGENLHEILRERILEEERQAEAKELDERNINRYARKT